MILKEIKERHSPIFFQEKEIEKEKLQNIIEAARWAPSCFNNQEWKYVFVNKKDKTRRAFEEALSRGNAWAHKAPYLIAVGVNPKEACEVNEIPYYSYDLGLSVMNAVLQAQHEGISAHQMAGYDEKKVKKALGFKKEDRVVVVFALGYEKEIFLEKRTRKQINENFFFGGVGKND
jgi:nitroreductase